MKTLKKAFSTISPFGWFLLIFVLGAILRLWNLSQQPLGITHDELDMIVTAKSFLLTRSDLTGQWQWWKLQPVITETVMAELAGFINVPALALFPLSLWSSRITAVIFSLLTMVVLYRLSFLLFRNKNIALCTLLAYAISPWSILFSRTAFEAPVSLFWYLFATVSLISLAQTPKVQLKSRILWFLGFAVSAFLAFFSYHGLKFVAVEWFGFLSLWLWWNGRKDHKASSLGLWMSGATTLVVLFFLTILLHRSPYTQRGSELVISHVEEYAPLSTKMKQSTLWPKPIRYVLMSKYALAVQQMEANFLGFFDLKTQFLTGESLGTFSLWNHGYFYAIDVVFILFGLYYLITRKEKNGWLLAGLLVISILASAIHVGQSYVLRSGLAYPLVLLVIGVGMSTVLEQMDRLKNTRVKNLFLAGGVFSVVLSVGYFLSLFYFYYPLSSSENFFFTERVVSNYLARLSPEQKVVVVSSNPYALVRANLFYNGLFTKEMLMQLRPQFLQSSAAKFTVKNVQFTADCKQTFDSNAVVIVDYTLREECKKTVVPQLEKPSDSPRAAIVKIDDSGEVFSIYRDPLCKKPLKSFVTVTSFKDLTVEKLDNEMFCQDWIVRQVLANPPIATGSAQTK